MFANPRFLYISVFMLCTAALIVALISQHAFGMRPCAWCVFQRLMLVVVGLSSLVAAFFSSPKRSPLLSRIFSIIATITAIGGIVAAWYQYTVASNSFSCDLSFADTVMTQSGLESGMPFLFGIYATCMDARVDLFGIEYALWGMVTFVLTIALIVWAYIKQTKQKALRNS